MSRDEHIQALLKKYADNTCTEEELEMLHNWLDEMAGEGALYPLMNEADKKKVRDEIYKPVLSTIDLRVKKMSWWRYLSVAAAVLCIVVGVYYYTTLHTNKGLIELNSKQGIVTKSVLPDSSIIWLNEHTRILYSANFTNNRTVEIKEGEVFFEVKKDASHPFTVITNDIHTVVMGTSFSVKKMMAGDVKVSVVTGKVLVQRNTDSLGFILPGQRLRYASADNKVKIDSALSLEANGWINGEILLQNVSLNEVADWLQNHYNVEVKNLKKGYSGEYYLQVEKNITLEKVLHILNLIDAKNNVHFKIQNNTIIIQ